MAIAGIGPLRGNRQEPEGRVSANCASDWAWQR